MTFLISGQTFNYREVLKDMGGKYDGDTKTWRLPSSADRDKLNRLVGCVVRNEETVSVALGDDPLPVATRNGPTNVHGDDPTYLNYFVDKNPVSFFGFSNLEALTSFVECVPRTRDLTWDADASFAGTATFTDAVDLARNGWSEGIEKAQEIIEFLDVKHAQQKKRVYAVAGGRVNVGRMLAGHPAHMIGRKKQDGRRNITLFVETAISSVIKPRKAVVRAACIAALVDILETQGYSCEIVATNMTVWGYPRKPVQQLACTIKSAGEKLNLSDVVFALGHPSFERRFNFACVMSDKALSEIHDTKGSASVAFNDAYQPGPNEFYITEFTGAMQELIRGDDLQEQALSLLPHLIPDGVPIEIDNARR